MSPFEILRTRKLIVPMLVIFLAMLVQTSWVEEDAFITLRTADNFIHGHGLRWNIAERVQTYTNPLWMFLLAGVHQLVANPHLTLLLLSITVSLLALTVLLIFIPQNNFGLLLAFAIPLLSKAFIDYSTSGLENPASHLFAVCFAGFFFSVKKPFSDRSIFILSLIVGLSAFNRMDTLIFYIPALAYICFSQRSVRTVKLMLAGLAPFILWEVFAIIYYGFPVPNTYYAKLNTGVPLGQSLAQGGLYFLNSLGWDPITLTVIISALGLTFIHKRRDDLLVALGLALYLGYILYIGGDFMSGRFFSTPLVLAVILLVRHTETSSAFERTVWLGLVLLLGLILAPLKSFANPLESDLLTFDNTTGIADERNGYYAYSNLLLLSRAQDFKLYPFAEYGLYLKNERIKVTVASGIGMAGYYAGPQVHIIDELALGDPLLARLHPSDLSEWNIAHFRRDLPPGYFESLESGENKLLDPALAEYYDQLLLITRGDLWSRARWQAIWKMNTGQYQHLLDAYRTSAQKQNGE